MASRRDPGATVVHRDGPEGTGSDSSWIGHLLAALIALGGLYVANNLLEWDIVPFLTDDFDRVLPLVNLSLAANLATNVVRLAYRPPWFIAATDLVGTGLGLPAIVRMWQVFPFDFDESGLPWDVAIRILLVVAFAGSVIAMIAATVRLAGEPFRSLRSGGG
jgi:hypothetical protein